MGAECHRRSDPFGRARIHVIVGLLVLPLSWAHVYTLVSQSRWWTVVELLAELSKDDPGLDAQPLNNPTICD